ncbi:MAG: 4'-phosphopantetheinyl transferase superfamily protein [Solobacterium sp.]|nr:4'-phosphopantetheinyl transferase superfamily protein [Solobacterium sp.]
MGPENTKIYVYAADVRPLKEESLYDQVYSLASFQCLQKIRKYPSDQQRLSLGGELLLRKCLKDLGYTGIHLQYTYGRYGKPYLENYPGLYFNLSHAGDYVILSVSDTETGCDIEKIRDIDLTVARRYFCKEEYEDILRDPGKQKEVFFRYWTLKESFTKILGQGLLLPMNAFRIDLTGPDVQVIQEINTESYSFHEPVIAPEYHCAVCTAQEVTTVDLRMTDLPEIIKG